MRSTAQRERTSGHEGHSERDERKRLQHCDAGARPDGGDGDARGPPKKQPGLLSVVALEPALGDEALAQLAEGAREGGYLSSLGGGALVLGGREGERGEERMRLAAGMKEIGSSRDLASGLAEEAALRPRRDNERREYGRARAGQVGR